MPSDTVLCSRWAHLTEFNSSRYRASTPATVLHSAGHPVRILNIAEWLTSSSAGNYASAWADVIVLQRVLVEESVKQAQLWKSRGKAIVIDYDDDYFRINRQNAAFRFWGSGEVDVSLKDGHRYTKTMHPLPIDQFYSGLDHVTAATMPSRVLARDIQHRIPAFFLPNYMDMNLYRTEKRQNDHIVIAWGGSLSHVESFEGSGVEEGLAQLFSERDDIRFLSIGDTRVRDRLPIPPSKLLFQPYVKFNVWSSVLARYDIGIAPLAYEYDCRRSFIKVLEYLIMGIPFVATKSFVYQDFWDVQYNKATSGLFVEQGEPDKCDQRNAEGWYHHLKDVVDNYAHYKNEADTHRQGYIDQYAARENVDNIIDVYQQIVDLV